MARAENDLKSYIGLLYGNLSLGLLAGKQVYRAVEQQEPIYKKQLGHYIQSGSRHRGSFKEKVVEQFISLGHINRTVIINKYDDKKNPDANDIIIDAPGVQVKTKINKNVSGTNIEGFLSIAEAGSDKVKYQLSLCKINSTSRQQIRTSEIQQFDSIIIANSKKEWLFDETATIKPVYFRDLYHKFADGREFNNIIIQDLVEILNTSALSSAMFNRDTDGYLSKIIDTRYSNMEVNNIYIDKKMRYVIERMDILENPQDSLDKIKTSTGWVVQQILPVIQTNASGKKALTLNKNNEVIFKLKTIKETKTLTEMMNYLRAQPWFNEKTAEEKAEEIRALEKERQQLQQYEWFNALKSEAEKEHEVKQRGRSRLSDDVNYNLMTFDNMNRSGQYWDHYRETNFIFLPYEREWSNKVLSQIDKESETIKNKMFTLVDQGTTYLDELGNVIVGSDMRMYDTNLNRIEDPTMVDIETILKYKNQVYLFKTGQIKINKNIDQYSNIKYTVTVKNTLQKLKYTCDNLEGITKKYVKNKKETYAYDFEDIQTVEQDHEASILRFNSVYIARLDTKEYIARCRGNIERDIKRMNESDDMHWIDFYKREINNEKEDIDKAEKINNHRILVVSQAHVSLYIDIDTDKPLVNDEIKYHYNLVKERVILEGPADKPIRGVYKPDDIEIVVLKDKPTEGFKI